MDIGLLNIGGIKKENPKAQGASALMEADVVEGGLFFSMLQGMQEPTLEEKTSPAPSYEPSHSELTSPALIEHTAINEIDIKPELQLNLTEPDAVEQTLEAQTIKPVILNNTVGEEAIEVAQPITEQLVEPKKPANVQLAFLMNDVARDLQASEQPKVTQSLETPIDSPVTLTTDPEQAIKTISVDTVKSEFTAPKPPKKFITTAPQVHTEVQTQPATNLTNSVKPVAEPMLEEKAKPAFKTEEAVEALPKNNTPLPIVAALPVTLQIEMSPTKLEYTKLVPHKVISTTTTPLQNPIEEFSAPLIKADFEQSVLPLVKGFEIAENSEILVQQPLDQAQLQLPKTLTNITQEYKPIEKVTITDKAIPQQISMNLMKSIENGKQSMTFKLHPADLGEVDIKFQTSKEGVTQVSILSDKFTTFDTLAKSVHQIENILTQNGFKSENLSIDVGLKDSSQNKEQTRQGNEMLAFQNKLEEVNVDLIQFKPAHNGLLNIVI